MAISLTLKTSGTAATTGSFTPSNNSLLIAVVGQVDATGGAPTVSGGSLSWTSQKTADSGGSFPSQLSIYTAPVTTGASMTVTGSPTTGGTIHFVLVYEATGHDTSTPVGATGNSTGANGVGTTSLSYSLSASPASTSYAISGVQTQVNADTTTGVSVGSGWTLDFSSPALWHPNYTSGCESRTSSTSSTVAWANIAVSDSAYSYAAAAVEIKAAGAASAGAIPIFHKSTRFFTKRF